MESGVIDFDPLTVEGEENINKTVDDEYQNLLPKTNETADSYYSRIKQRFGRGYNIAIDRINELFSNSNRGRNIPNYIELHEFDGFDNGATGGVKIDSKQIAELETKPMKDIKEKIEDLSAKTQTEEVKTGEDLLKIELEKKEEALIAINSLFTEWDKDKIIYTKDEYGSTKILKAKGGKKWYHLNTLDDFEKLPESMKEYFKRDIEDEEEYKSCHDYLNKFFPDNKIPEKYDKETGIDIGFDIDQDDAAVIYDNETDTWLKIFNKDGSIRKRLPQRIKDLLGESAIEKADELTKKLISDKEKIEHIEANVVILDKKIDDSNDSMVSNTNNLQGLEDFIDKHHDELTTVGLTRDEIEEAESEFEIYSGSIDHLDSAEKQLDVIQKKRSDLIQENNKLIDSVERLKSQKENLEKQKIELVKSTEDTEERIGVLEENLPLRERIKRIIKKYGLTVTGVAIAAATIIVVIINSLKSGLTNLAKGVGNGLKTIGQKLGQILPGMIGAIASYIFRTAGQVVGFLAKHAWLLILAVVMWMVERYKNKK